MYGLHPQDGSSIGSTPFGKVKLGDPRLHVAVRVVGPGSATLVRLMPVESGRSVLRAANPGRPDMELTRANETTIRAVVVFVGRAE